MRSVSARRTRSPTVGPNICAYSARVISCAMAFVFCLRQGPHHLPIESKHEPGATVCHELHVAGLPRLEPHGRSRRNVEAISRRGASIERERGVGFGKVKVTANL